MTSTNQLAMKMMKKSNIMIALAATLLLGAGCGLGSGEGSSSGDSKGGSMARFTIKGDMLYTVTNTSLRVLSIDEPDKIDQPSKELDERSLAASDVETIFTMDDLLFIGSGSAMFVYDISNPPSPTKLSKTTHFRSCDPVVADGELAFVTLNTSRGTWCGSAGNALKVYKIEDVRAGVEPVELGQYTDFTSPAGLAVDGPNKIVFVCDGRSGVRALDFTDPAKIKLLFRTAGNPEAGGLDAWDCIVERPGVLMVIGERGLYQLGYTRDDDKGKFTLLSKIEIKRDL